MLKKIAKRKKLKIFDISEELKKLKNLNQEFKSDFKFKNLAMAIKALKLCNLKEKNLWIN